LGRTVGGDVAASERRPMTIGREHHLDIDGARVHAVDWVPAGTTRDGADADRHVLLVHGLGANTVSWELVGQGFADSLGAVVTAIDLFGFGRTRARARAQATVGSNRRLVTSVLERLGPSMLIGNSMGASIGIGVAARRPELLTSLVMVNPALPHPNPGVGDYARLSRFAPVMVTALGRHVLGTRARFLGPERLVDASLASSVHDLSRLDPTVRRRLVELAAERYAYPEAPAAYADAARSMLLYLGRGLHDDLTQVADQLPMLLVHGEFDRLVNVAAARAVAARYPGIDFRELDGVGHAPQLEVPDRLVAVVEGWLPARMSAWPIQPSPLGSSTSRSSRSSAT
jgi:pimeloyl-ACP methyl ester carboxylesterase